MALGQACGWLRGGTLDKCFWPAIARVLPQTWNVLVCGVHLEHIQRNQPGWPFVLLETATDVLEPAA